MTATPRQMHLAAFFFPPGAHFAGWRLPEAAADSDMNFKHYLDITLAAERGKMDAVFFQDSNASAQSEAIARRDPVRARHPRAVVLEPLMVLPALAAYTKRIGLIATQTTTYNEPYQVARHFATLDHISGGRAGWNLVTTQSEDEAGNFGYDKHVEHALRYERANEFYDVVCGLWDSWDGDAFVRNKESGIYFDPAKARLIRHEGKFFRVRGPLNIARCPQGRPVVAQAGSSPVGRDLAARSADMVFTAQVDKSRSRSFIDDLKSRAGQYNRAPAHIKVLPGFIPIIGQTVQEAQDKFGEMQDLISDDMALASLKRHAGGVDLTAFPIDGPLPPLGQSNSAKGRQELLIEMGRSGMSIRELGRYFCAGSGHRIVVGTPRSIADDMEEWFTHGAADGFTLFFPYAPGPAHSFVDGVVPELQRRGLFRREYTGATLRDHLGVPTPQRQDD